MFTESDVKTVSDLVKTLSCLCKPCLSIKQVKNKTNLFTYESGSPLALSSLRLRVHFEKGQFTD